MLTTVRQLENAIEINEDGIIRQLPSVWLRDVCSCPLCIHQSTRQKLHSSGDIPLSITPSNIKIAGKGRLMVTWPSALASDKASEHKSEYNIKQLLDLIDHSPQ